jgi:hypothetical protein
MKRIKESGHQSKLHIDDKSETKSQKVILVNVSYYCGIK